MRLTFSHLCNIDAVMQEPPLDALVTLTWGTVPVFTEDKIVVQVPDADEERAEAYDHVMERVALGNGLDATHSDDEDEADDDGYETGDDNDPAVKLERKNDVANEARAALWSRVVAAKGERERADVMKEWMSLYLHEYKDVNVPAGDYGEFSELAIEMKAVILGRYDSLADERDFTLETIAGEWPLVQAIDYQDAVEDKVAADFLPETAEDILSFFVYQELTVPMRATSQYFRMRASRFWNATTGIAESTQTGARANVTDYVEDDAKRAIQYSIGVVPAKTHRVDVASEVHARMGLPSPKRPRVDG